MSQHEASGQAPLVWEPSLAAVRLPRCHDCGGKHPLAYNPPLPADTCPECAAVLPTVGPALEVAAVLTGWSSRAVAARLCFAIGRWAANLWRSRQ